MSCFKDPDGLTIKDSKTLTFVHKSYCFWLGPFRTCTLDMKFIIVFLFAW